MKVSKSVVADNGVGALEEPDVVVFATEFERTTAEDKREPEDCLEEVTVFEVFDLEPLVVPALPLVTFCDCGGGFAAFSVSTVVLALVFESVDSLAGAVEASRLGSVIFS